MGEIAELTTVETFAHPLIQPIKMLKIKNKLQPNELKTAYALLKKSSIVIVLLSSLVVLNSCLTISKIIVGFKTPKVYNVNEIKNLKEEIFKDDLNNDYYFKGIKDTVFLNKILSLSFRGSLNIYNNKGEKIHFKKTACINDEIKIITNKVASLQFNSDTETLATDLKNVLNINSNDQFKLSNLKENEYYVIYYWSSFMEKKKSIKSDYDFLKNSLDNNCKIIRVNCDFLDIWGLKKGKKLKLQITKEKKGRYNIQFKKIPWK